MTNINRNRTVVSYEDLVHVIKAASPGDIITLKNGIWTDINLDFKGIGTAEQPIILRAETLGEVIFTGASTLSISGEHLVVDGLYFKEGIQPGKGGSNTVIRFLPESRYCRLTNSAIVDYHALDREKKYFWVTIDGSNNQVDHCYFKGKDYAGQLMKNLKYSSYNQIDHNYFVDIPAYGINGLEIIQVMGIGSDGEPGSAGGEYVVIENNLFERADGECEEIISVKSNHDRIRNNTFKDSIGGVVIRSGHNTVVEGNFFIGGNVAGTKGIRITGEDNIVSGNYLTGLQGFALSIMAGEFIERALTEEWVPVLREGTPLGRVPVYNAAKNNTIAGNIMIHNDGVDIDIGIGYKSAWPTKQRILLPEENELSDNIIVKTSGAVITMAQQDPSVMDVAFAPNRFENNFVGTKTESTPLPEGMAYSEITLRVTKDGLYHPVMENAAQDIKMPSNGPLNENHVGPEWVKQKRKEGEPLFQPRDQFATVESLPWDPKTKLWVLCTGSSDVFVQNMRTKLDVNRREVCPLEKEGSFLLPVRSVAEKLGLRVTSGAYGEEIRVIQESTTVIISTKSCKIIREDQESPSNWIPLVFDGTVFLPAEAMAEIFGKCLFRNDQGLIVFSDSIADAAMFEDKSVIDRTFELFKVVASSFEKNMTIPPTGHTHGRIPANTLSNDPSFHWSSYGDGQWIRFDLGRMFEVGSVGIAFVKGEDIQYGLDIEVSANGFNWTKVFSGISSGDTNDLEIFALERGSARFVRLIGHMNAVSNANRFSRVQVYTAQGQGIL